MHKQARDRNWLKIYRLIVLPNSTIAVNMHADSCPPHVENVCRLISSLHVY